MGMRNNYGGGRGRRNRNFARGYGRGYYPPQYPDAPVRGEQELDVLKRQADQLSNELESIRRRISEIESG
jgi:hypothetical protein